MKSLLLFGFLASAIFTMFVCPVENAYSQSTSTLIHYWNFNSSADASASYTNPNIPNIKADYSVIDTNTATINYVLEPGTSPTYAGYLDFTTGDTVNARMAAASGNALRVRNPTDYDSMEVDIHLPSTGYKNLVLSWALESSSIGSGQSVENYAYSVDGGTTWKTSGLTVNGDPVDTLNLLTYGQATQGKAIYEKGGPDPNEYSLETITFGDDMTVNDNANLVFRIKFSAQNGVGGGNNRFDNITLEGIGKPASASISVTTPDVGNILVPGQLDTISFTIFSTVGQDRTIEFSVDGGSIWTQVAKVTGVTSYVWTVPDVQTNTGVIRVTDSAGVTGISNAFVIYPVNPVTNRMVHYWDFNTLNAAYTNPNIPAIPADFSANPSNPGSVVYTLKPGTSSTYAGYIDNVGGDTTNAHFGETAGNALRIRNPSDSMSLDLHIPTTGYKGISISYALQSSSLAGAHTQHFSYSTGSNIFVATGITVNGVAQDTLDVTQTQYQSATGFGLVTIGFGSQTTMDDNPNFIFRITFSDSASGTSGNNRFDNISVDATGSTASGVAEPLQASQQLNVSPNPAEDAISFENPFTSLATVTVLDMLGREVMHSDADASSNVEINTSKLIAGSYYIHIRNVSSGAEQLAKFVKQ